MLEAMQAQQVAYALAIGVTLERFADVLGFAERHPHIFATVGVHPEETGCEEADVQRLCELASHAKVVGIGETGLDYYWHKDRPEWQRQRFRVHIEAARQCKLPLVIHNRDASADTLAVLAEESASQCGGVFHCFTGDVALARQVLDLGFYVSFSGIVTFKNAADIKAAARFVPDDRILIETDAPFLAPVPHRGKKNQPAWVAHVAEEVARLRASTPERIGEQTSANFFRLFQRAQPLAA